jgi:hypothetical protein
LKNRKNIIDDEPLWKKRRREEAKEARKSKLWTVGIAATIVVVLGFMVWVMVYRPWVSQKNEPRPKPQSGLATVVDKTIEQKDGKTVQHIVFKMGDDIEIQKEVDAKAFDSVNKGQEFLLTYEISSFSGAPTKILSWKVPKYAKPVGSK